jgi:hypothetical protein
MWPSLSCSDSDQKRPVGPDAPKKKLTTENTEITEKE